MIFEDGKLPYEGQVEKWLKLVDDFFDGPESGKAGSAAGSDARRIGVHCDDGLGRAPLLVAIALVHKGAHPEEAIGLIRETRIGALNSI